MREIKFRAWDELLQAWVHEPLWFEGSTAFALRDGSFLELNTIRIKVSQYTGLKDKNGKEIYEGDVVNEICEDCETVECGEVIFADGVFGWKHGDGPMIFQQDDYDYEVIGNVYEHPNLIENDKS